jgi:hypothetical protein
MSLKAELKQILYDFSLIAQPGRTEIAHFCEHDNIRIRYIRARTTWQSLTPKSLRPWLMILEPLKSGGEGINGSNDDDRTVRTEHNNNYKAEEVNENA